VASLIPHCRRGFGPNIKATGVIDEEGMLIAGIVYHRFDPDAGTIEISGAALPGKQWLSRETLKQMYRYPFFVCGCQMVIQLTPADNEGLLYVLHRFGYELIPFSRMFGRDRDGVICRLTREAWEENKFNKRLKHHLPDALPSIHEAA
jgi:RimJ/RimL family protein N-acetyltransferase